jgi:hypothetical protein
MDQGIRNELRNVVTKCRKLLEEAVSQVLQGQFGIYAGGKKDEIHVEEESRMKNLSEEDKGYRRDIQAHLGHTEALGYKAKDALAQMVREIAFTHLNRLCAYKMMEARAVWVGGKPFRESVSRGMKSPGFLFYLADHADEKKLFDTGHQDVGYRHFLGWLGALLSEEIGVLFSPTDPANRLFPPQRVLDDVLALLNSDGLKDIWTEDETIGWVYQYFTPKELRDQVRKESAAPRNSYELAFRNQFFTPRYVVEFLTDNTLGRIWYEMRKGNTKLKDQCRYMVRRPMEFFLAEGQTPPETTQNQEELSQEELLKQTVYIPNRPKKDPRELRILDPACGSGHFLLYCFDLLLTIYEEAYVDPDLGPKLKDDYPTLEALRRDVPRLILVHNLHGIDIDLRASQIAALALWLRCQRAYGEMGLKQHRPKITKSNIVCAEPMPGESEMLKEFVANLHPNVLGHLVEVVFDKMKFAGEAGSLLKIEEELRDAIADAKKHWAAEHEQGMDRKGRPFLFSRAEMERLANKTPQPQLFDFSEITDEQFWNEAETQVLTALRGYAAHASTGDKLQRQLFAADAERGFAFIDLCQKQFDVVLMNPPFGEPTESTRQYIIGHLSKGRNDLYTAMIVRCAGLLASHCSSLGVITSRAFLLGRDHRDFRANLLADDGARITHLLDLGSGVLDGALVETAAYVLSTLGGEHLLYCDSRHHDEYQPSIDTEPQNNGWMVEPLSKFRRLPESQFMFGETGDRFLAVGELPRFEAFADVTHGLETGDDPRFVRLKWEVNPKEIGTTWFLFSKGGDYSWWSSDTHLLVNRKDGGAEMAKHAATHTGNVARTRASSKFYGEAAATYSRRSQKGFSVRRLRRGCCFGDKSGVIFPRRAADEWLLTLPLLLASTKYIDLLQAQVKFGSYEIGAVKRLPWPAHELTSLKTDAVGVYELLDLMDAFDETSSLFIRQEPSGCRCTVIMEKALDLVNVALHRVGLSLDPEVQRHQRTLAAERERELAGPSSLLSYVFGIVCGRWDVRTSTESATGLPNARDYEEAPLCPKGMLQESDGQPARTTPHAYPLEIKWDGIIPDDLDHSDDIVRRVREVLELIWKDRAEAIEKEACEVLGVKELREYFRKPGKGGFWDDHVSRYSKSRRKAPIYWLLQSSKKNYGLWLYYHRLDKDILFKARQNYVDPKIRLEQSRLDTLRSQKTALGAAAKGAKKIDKDMERQEALLGELKDFADKLERAAKLNFGKEEKLNSDVRYDPDLNDGVVLNIAPLWELVPWKEAKNFWEELLEGKYEWSSMGKLLRKKGLVSN